MHTLVLSVAVAVPCSAHSVMFGLVLAGASFSPKQTAGLVNNPGQSLQRLQCSIYCVGHVGTEPKDLDEDYVVIFFTNTAAFQILKISLVLFLGSKNICYTSMINNTSLSINNLLRVQIKYNLQPP